MAEFAYNNKIHSSTQTLPFKGNYRQDSRMGFEGRKKRKYEGAKKFVEKIKEIQEKAKSNARKIYEKVYKQKESRS